MEDGPIGKPGQVVRCPATVALSSVSALVPILPMPMVGETALETNKAAVLVERILVQVTDS